MIQEEFGLLHQGQYIKVEVSCYELGHPMTVHGSGFGDCEPEEHDVLEFRAYDEEGEFLFDEDSADGYQYLAVKARAEELMGYE